ncbi:hypothetical protein DPMN_117457 [Dreissena polymorpha]|uniref:Uncharacterized protein n=2 Tax=Dreissena polymorpha TaxID=45954 RepID=A0A9D4KQ06_DREPO|nr:hypothetical protein DPMN_117457 [Dreissena polymorpha]
MSDISASEKESSEKSSEPEDEGRSSTSSYSDIEERYLEKARLTEGSVLDITYEVLEPEKEDVSYRPTLSEEEDAMEDIDINSDEDVDFSFDISIREADEDNDHMEIIEAGDLIFDVSEEKEADQPEEEEITTEADRQEEVVDLVRERKCIAFDRNLLELARLKVTSVCDRKNCRSNVKMTTKRVGSSTTIQWKCEAKAHLVKQWSSQPVVRKKPAGDIILSTAILVSGNNYEKVRLLATVMNLNITPSTQHHQYLSHHGIPIIKEEFDEMIRRNREKYAGHEVVIMGDGRMDSPGFSAQYCTYTVMTHDSKDLLACVIVNKRETNMTSTLMEREGLKRCLQQLQDAGIFVKELVTDASTTISSMIAKEYQHITHSFDMWHGGKNFGRKLAGVAAEAKNKELRPWVPDIVNHFWYSCSSCDGDADLLEDKLVGILHHVVDDHVFPLGECEHGELQEDPSKPYIESGSPAHIALTKAVMDARFINNLPFFKNFRHTGELETFHEHILMYAAKRFAYTHPVYKARNYLACLDYQAHKERKVLTDKDGKPRQHRKYSKRGHKYTTFAVKEKKTYTYVPNMIHKVVQHFAVCAEPLTAPVKMSPTDPRKKRKTLGSPDTPPPTSSLAKQSRFKLELE